MKGWLSSPNTDSFKPRNVFASVEHLKFMESTMMYVLSLPWEGETHCCAAIWWKTLCNSVGWITAMRSLALLWGAWIHLKPCYFWRHGWWCCNLAHATCMQGSEVGWSLSLWSNSVTVALVLAAVGTTAVCVCLCLQLVVRKSPWLEYCERHKHSNSSFQIMYDVCNCIEGYWHDCASSVDTCDSRS